MKKANLFPSQQENQFCLFGRLTKKIEFRIFQKKYALLKPQRHFENENFYAYALCSCEADFLIKNVPVLKIGEKVFYPSTLLHTSSRVNICHARKIYCKFSGRRLESFCTLKESTQIRGGPNCLKRPSFIIVSHTPVHMFGL